MKVKNRTNAPSSTVEGKNFTEPYSAEEGVVRSGVYTIQITYPLPSLEFSELLTEDSKVSKVIDRLLTISVGYLIIVIAKYIAWNLGQTIVIESYEFIAPFVAIILFFLIRIISGKFYSSKRNTIIKKITKFFNENPAKLQTKQ